LQQNGREIEVEESINDYLLDLVEATRRSDDLQVGVSTRGIICLYRASQAWALLHGRAYVVPDDVKTLAVPVLGHRVLPSGYYQSSARRELVEDIIARIVDATPTPH
jgi:MoxR-like ATPase